LLQAAAILAVAFAFWFAGLDERIGRAPPAPLPTTVPEPPAPVVPVEGLPDEAQTSPQEDRDAFLSEGDAPYRLALYLPAIASGAGAPRAEPGLDAPPAVRADRGGELARWAQLSDPYLDLPVSQARLRAVTAVASLVEAARTEQQPAAPPPSVVTEAHPDPDAAAVEPGDPGEASVLSDGGAALPEPEMPLVEIEPQDLDAASVALAGPDVFGSPLAPPVGGPGVPAPVADERWVWPVRGVISQYYSSKHGALDISADQGAIVVAADDGRVVYAKWQSSGYGYLVIVDHGDGFLTYYAHLYGFYVDVGKSVARGEPLGELGNTGRSTGPHLHFEIRSQGVQQDPWQLLPPP
jgi:murein DD-endopeptidase MepM/ murein hydrolase activator NlpD